MLFSPCLKRMAVHFGDVLGIHRIIFFLFFIFFLVVCRTTRKYENFIQAGVYRNSEWRGMEQPICLVLRPNRECSVQFSHSVMSDSLRPHESQHTRPPCPLPTPGVHSDSRPSSQWCHPAISFSVIPFSCPQSFPASGGVHAIKSIIYNIYGLQSSCVSFFSLSFTANLDVYFLLISMLLRTQVIWGSVNFLMVSVRTWWRCNFLIN